MYNVMYLIPKQAQNYRLVSIKMDISAPHIILPEDFKNKQTSLVSLLILICVYAILTKI